MATSIDRLDELLALRATQRLTPAQQAELEALLAEHGGRDRAGLDRAAAAIHVGALREPQPLPPRLRERLERQALEYLASRRRDAADDETPSSER